MLILPAVLIVAGIYVMIAAHAPSYPLFGRSRVQRAEKRRQKAEYYLAKFHDIGDFYARGHGDVDMQKVSEYYTNLRNYLLAAWGIGEHSSAAKFPDTADPIKMAIDISARLDIPEGRRKDVPALDNFTWESDLPWRIYFDKFWQETDDE